ncbi:MAG: prephenate dehydratase, partial [Flavobacteriia bacterium]
MGLKIAIQGIKGSNHHQVAKDFFGDDIELLECMTFDAIIDHLLDGTADKGIMAIENSIAGSIIPNYNLVYHNKIHVIGEHYLSIHHNLMVLKGTTMEYVKEVHSHPMALLQCKKYFRQFPHIRLVEDSDTAETAKRIKDQKIKGIAAIGSKVAAEMYDLDILSA